MQLVKDVGKYVQLSVECWNFAEKFFPTPQHPQNNVPPQRKNKVAITQTNHIENDKQEPIKQKQHKKNIK